MTNEEYQRLLRAPAPELRERLPGGGRGARDLRRLLADLDDEQVMAAVRDLGGHDLRPAARRVRARPTRSRDRPSVIFAYTIKAWRLPTEGHPGNHSALLDDEQWRALAAGAGRRRRRPVGALRRGLAGGRAVRAGRRAARAASRSTPTAPPPVPAELGRDARRPRLDPAGVRALLRRPGARRRRRSPSASSRSVRTSPRRPTSAAGSTVSAIWHLGERIDWFADDTDTLVRWRESEHGQHIELGIAEGNLVGLLAELGLTWSRDGEPLLPIGTLYDPFVNRALEPWSFGLYAGAQSILVGTPSGVTLAPEGGAHQSIITPSVGLEQPRCVGLGARVRPGPGVDAAGTRWPQLGRPDGELGVLPAHDAAGRPGAGRASPTTARRATRAGAHGAGRAATSLRRAESAPAVTLVGVGAVMPEVLRGRRRAGARPGRPVDVVCLTSADLVFRALRARQGLADGDDGDPRRAAARRPRARRSSPCSTATRTR